MFKEQIQKLQKEIKSLEDIILIDDLDFYYEEICCGKCFYCDGKKLLELVEKYKQHLKETTSISEFNLNKFEKNIQDELKYFSDFEEKSVDEENQKILKNKKQLDILSQELIKLFKDNGYQEVVISVKDFNLYDCQDLHSVLNSVYSNNNHEINSKTIRFLSNDENIRDKIVNEWKRMHKHQDLKSKFNFLDPSINLCLNFKI